MPQPRLQARVFADRDDVANQTQDARDRIDASWLETTKRLDLDDLPQAMSIVFGNTGGTY